MLNYSYITLIPLIPFIIFVILGIWGRKYIKQWSGILATLGLLASTILSVYAAWQYFFIAGKENGVSGMVLRANCHCAPSGCVTDCSEPVAL